MDKKLRELIRERFYGIKKEGEIDKKVREWDSYYRGVRIRKERREHWRTKLSDLLIGDGERWYLKRWLRYLLGIDRR